MKKILEVGAIEDVAKADTKLKEVDNDLAVAETGHYEHLGGHGGYGHG